MTAPAPSAPAAALGLFTSGSVLRHVTVMTATGSLGLIAVFMVDALNLYYISLLGQQELAAAIGFAGTLQFFLVAVAIGLTIATSATVSRALGQGDRTEAARRGGAALTLIALCSAALAGAIYPFLDELLALLGAEGETRAVAAGFLRIVVPSVPLLAVGMGASGILRAVGDARGAMYVTLGAGIVAAALDPVLIFGLDLGVTGAAIATAFSRLCLFALGLWGAARVHRLVALPRLDTIAVAARPYFAIGVPAILTQVATPVGNAYVTAEIARFGDGAVAGWAVIGRLIPVAFGVIFALTGSVGPIIGQNLGAGRHDRVRATIRDSLLLTCGYTLAVWGLMALFRNPIADIFGATGEARELIVFFCLAVAASFLFNGALFVANTCFNNMGFAAYSTFFNWGRATLGIIPFVWLGGRLGGAPGVLAGWGLGAVVFGVAAVVVCFRLLDRMGPSGGPEPGPGAPPPPASGQSPFTTGKAAALG